MSRLTPTPHRTRCAHPMPWARPARRTAAVLAAVVLATVSCVAAASPVTSSPTATSSRTARAGSEGVTTRVLGNGMRVTFVPDHRLPKVVVSVAVGVGSKDEPPGRSGFAHLFEHLMFMGTARVGRGEYDRIIESYGGEDNAYTDDDLTLYWSTAPASALPTLLWLEADRLEGLGTAIDRTKLDLQREVVLNERRQTVEDTPYGAADDAITRLLYPDDHPYHRGTIGSPTDLRAATVTDVRQFFATYYVPNNVSLLVAGDFDADSTAARVDALFGTLPRRNDVIHRSTAPGVAPQTPRITFVDHVTEPRVSLLWRAPPDTAPSHVALQLAASVVQSRVDERLVDTGVASSVSVGVDPGLLESVLGVDAVPAEGVSPDALEAALRHELQRAAASASDAEVRAAAAEAQVASRATVLSLIDRAQAMNADALLFGDPGRSEANVAAAARTSPITVRAALADVLARPSLMLLVLPGEPAPPVADDGAGSTSAAPAAGPATTVVASAATPTSTVRPTGSTAAAGAVGTADAARTTTTAAPTNPRAQRPPDLAARPLTVPSAETFTLSNGIPVTYWRTTGGGVSAIEVVIAHGAADDTAPGTTDLLGALLDRGARTAGFDRAVKAAGASLSAGGGPTRTVVSLTALSERLPRATALMAEAITQPDLRADQFGVEQARLAQDADALQDDPGAVASAVADLQWFGATHALGRVLTGRQLRAVGADSVRALHASVVRPELMSVFAAGDRPAGELRAALEAALGRWRGSARDGGTPPAPTAPPVPPAPVPVRVVLVDRPGAAQTQIRIVSPAVTVDAPSRIADLLVATVLGGSFTSRLNTNLREDKGLTYGVSTGFVSRRSFGQLTTATSVDTPKTGAALRELQSELARLPRGITADERTKAVHTVEHALEDAFATPGALVANGVDQQALGRDLPALAADRVAVGAVSSERLAASARTLYDGSHALWVLVGDRAQVLPQLRGLGLPDPVLVTLPR